jgi:hypothetical protein
VAGQHQDRAQGRGGVAIAQATRDEGGPLVTFGGITTWNDLLAADDRRAAHHGWRRCPDRRLRQAGRYAAQLVSCP